MFALESPTGLLVIESREVPFFEVEVLTVVFGVTADAFQARTHLDVVGSVQPFSRPDAPRNFGVAVQALERGLSGRKLVAGSAVSHAIDRLVRARKRTRRNLRRSCNRSTQDTQHDPPGNSWPRKSTNTLCKACV